MKRKTSLVVLAILVFGIIFFLYFYQNKEQNGDSEQNELLSATPVPVTPEDLNKTPHDTSALGGYNVLIADRGSNRILEVTPDKKIVWEYDFNLPKMGLGADDAFFTDGGKSVIVNLEYYHVIQIIDYASKKVIWSYGVPGKPGATNGMLNTPDDAYKLSNGNIIVADIKNCRVIEISPDKKIVNQYGHTGQCKTKEGYLNKPNGDTPLPDGHIFISDIVGRNLIELDSNWKKIFSMTLPVKYPSDPQLTQAGNILISDYSNPGKVVEVDRKGNILWQFDGQEGDVKMNRPSLAVELPNGNIITNDDYNDRVIVIDKNTKKIIWQYGVTGKPGSGPDQLNIPDGLNIIMRGASTGAFSPSGTIFKIGQVSRHPKDYVNRAVTMTGYVLEKQKSYAIFSDESTGIVGPYDLPVSGTGVDGLVVKKQYTIEGILRYQGLTSINNNLYHLEVINIINN